MNYSHFKHALKGHRLGYSRPRRTVTNLLSCALEAYLLTYLLIYYCPVFYASVPHLGLRCFRLPSSADATVESVCGTKSLDIVDCVSMFVANSTAGGSNLT